MNRSGLTPMTKLEVVVDASDVLFVEQLLEAEGATGWTGVPAASGFGHGGRSEGRLMFNDHTGPTMILAVLSDDVLDGVLAGMREFFATHAGVMFVSDTFVSRPEYFVATPA
jgi:nitrogen regulatory protein PII